MLIISLTCESKINQNVDQISVDRVNQLISVHLECDLFMRNIGGFSCKSALPKLSYNSYDNNTCLMYSILYRCGTNCADPNLMVIRLSEKQMWSGKRVLISNREAKVLSWLRHLFLSGWVMLGNTTIEHPTHM